MLDRYILPWQAKLLRGPAGWLIDRGVTANATTLCGFAIGLVAVPFIAFHAYFGALACILANRVSDGLDGAIARRVGPTDRGAFLDIVLDFFFYAAIPFGFALAEPQTNALAACVLLLSFVGTGSSFLGAAVVAERRKISAPAFPQKGIYYLDGLTEGTETIILFVLFCLWPGAFVPLAWTFAVLAFVTTLTRWRRGWCLFADTASDDS